jgi:hypothetical protein
MQIRIFIARCEDIKLHILLYYETANIILFILHIFTYITTSHAQTNFHGPVIPTFRSIHQIHAHTHTHTERRMAML